MSWGEFRRVVSGFGGSVQRVIARLRGCGRPGCARPTVRGSERACGSSWWRRRRGRGVCARFGGRTRLRSGRRVHLAEQSIERPPWGQRRRLRGDLGASPPELPGYGASADWTGAIPRSWHSGASAPRGRGMAGGAHARRPHEAENAGNHPLRPFRGTRGGGSTDAPAALKPARRGHGVRGVVFCGGSKGPTTAAQRHKSFS